VNRYYLPVIPLLGIVTTVILQTKPVLALERSEIAAQVKELTVQIEGQETTGTGTIIERNGNRYTILTCWHVVNAKGSFKITTPDGETHQVTDVKNLKDIDLAILQFTSNTTYQVAELDDSQTITEGTSNYKVILLLPLTSLHHKTL
jgi:S1-C subfamily serine protease